MNASQSRPSSPIDAATVVLVRDRADGPEVLMLRRTSKVHFGGMWVFPGGRVDPEDGDVESGDMVAFRRAAVREAEEEASIVLAEEGLVHLSHWLPPPIRPVRYSTHFFVSLAPDDLNEISVDQHEISEHAWLSPSEALAKRHRGEIEMVTPTFVTLDWLRRYSSAAEAIESVGEPSRFHTHITKVDDGQIAFYEGDAAYDSLDPAAPGPRRRVNMLSSGWWWEEHDGLGNGPWPRPVDFQL